jgi:SAM-dependent methyltransferase
MAETRRPSDWIVRFAPQVRAGGAVLDLACGGGRHARFFLGRGHPVVALDRDLSGVADLDAAERVQADLEDGSPWPLDGRRFAAVVAVNYLHRPLFPSLAAALEPGGLLLYETFGLGQERYGRPKNPDFLLRPGELLAAFAGLRVVAYEHGLAAGPAVRQRLCAVAGERLIYLEPEFALSSGREETA